MSRKAGDLKGRSPSPSFVRELLTACRFGVVGLAATSVHMLIVWSLVEAKIAPVLLSNFFAFLFAFGVSFAGHYHWTFRARGNPKAALVRFLVISGGAFVANTFLLAMILGARLFSPALSAVIAATLVPLITYVASRLWGFKDFDMGARPNRSEQKLPDVG